LRLQGGSGSGQAACRWHSDGVSLFLLPPAPLKIFFFVSSFPRQNQFELPPGDRLNASGMSFALERVSDAVPHVRMHRQNNNSRMSRKACLKCNEFFDFGTTDALRPCPYHFVQEGQSQCFECSANAKVAGTRKWRTYTRGGKEFYVMEIPRTMCVVGRHAPFL
jgi:hypothetical protein